MCGNDIFNTVQSSSCCHGILFNIQEGFFYCMWIKVIYTGSSYPVVLHYYYHSSSSNELRITANGQQTYVLNDGGLSSYHSRFTSPAGKWFNLCLTWSISSATSSLYLDGDLVGTDSTTSRNLNTGGGMCLGRLHPSYSSSSRYVFGGELFNLNLFSEVLSASEIKKAAQEGLCSRSLQHLESRVLKWEYIVSRSKSGSVVETDTGCEKTVEFNYNLTALLNETTVRLENELDVVTKTLNKTEDILNSTLEELTGTQDKLGTTEETLNSTLDKLGTTEETLNSTLAELQKTEKVLETEIAQHNGTAEELETCSDRLFDTRSQLKAARKFENISRWDVLYTEPFYNRVFTDELYVQLTSSWTMLRELC